MGDHELEVIWTELMQESFRSFIDENIGWMENDEDLPACFGSGDSRPWCVQCAARTRC